MKSTLRLKMQKRGDPQQPPLQPHTSSPPAPLLSSSPALLHAHQLSPSSSSDQHSTSSDARSSSTPSAPSCSAKGRIPLRHHLAAHSLLPLAQTQHSVRPLHSPPSASSPPSCRSLPTSPHNHPLYHGVRQRSWGKWVSEIRQPRKKTRIWLGSFSTPEMAARAHDVAVLSLKGVSAQFNFPEFVSSLPRPVSLDPRDIQSAAAAAAAAWRNRVSPCDARASREEQGSCIEREELQHEIGDCYGGHIRGEFNADVSYPVYETKERGQCEHDNEDRHSPVPGLGSVCEEAQHFFDSAQAGKDLYEDQMMLDGCSRYVFADMAEAMLIPPPPQPLRGGDIVEDDSNWDFWLWDHHYS